MTSYASTPTATHTFPPLYGYTTRGTVKIWQIRVESEDRAYETVPARIVITHGQYGGKQQQTTRRITAGKNLGHINATTPWTQAIAEATALWTKKQDKNYSPSMRDSAQRTQETRLPMLALKYEDRSHTVVWPAFVQPKLNGVRCLMERRGDDILFHSRGNKPFTTLGHLKADALAVLKDGDILDGELYAHQTVTFQELVSLIKNEKSHDAAKVAQTVQFWNYDVVDTEASFVKRASRLVEHGAIRRVPTYRVATEDEMRAYHQRFVAQGYEGTMVRSGDDPYRFQYRSPSLLKLKDMQDAEFTIVDVREGTGKSEGQAIFVCETAQGKTFGCRMRGTDDSRREQWTNRAAYRRKSLTVQYQTLSDDGVPVFPVGLAIREEGF